MTTQCTHGQLRRTCGLCERDEQVAALTRANAELTAEVATLQGEQRLLDGVVRALGIEDDSITPAEEAQRIMGELETAEAKLTALREAALPFADSFIRMHESGKRGVLLLFGEWYSQAVLDLQAAISKSEEGK